MFLSSSIAADLSNWIREVVWKDKVYQRLVDEWQINKITWGELLEDYMERFQSSCCPFPNLMETLEVLKSMQLKLGIISNGRTLFQKRNIHALKIAHYFDQIIISEEVGIKKPEPEIFQLALDRCQVSPIDSVFIGDHPENDIKAAQGVGMRGIWKRDDYWGEVNTEYKIDDLYEIIDIITSWEKTFE
ncbi:HAD family hydrolase [Gracilibacillus oryzae]|uniref:HAD family hydrolase n=1 Tax=Gracilibacillus oryzae TaxID=1672701 RepID=UPI003898F925